MSVQLRSFVAALRMRVVRSWLAGVVSMLALVCPANAVDQPIAGRMLKLKSTTTGARLVFLSRDPAVPFPPIGSLDDPATGTPGGMTVEIFSQTEGRASSTAPSGTGNPGWTVIERAVDAYVFRDTGLPLGKIVLRQGKLLNVRGDDVGLALNAPLGAVAIRITTGSQRSCALFDGATVRRDDPGTFVGREAAAFALPDCSDQSIWTAMGTSCTSGGDWPTCGGTCPDGGVCAATIFSQCICAFPSDPCGGTAPVCNGECPAGKECVVVEDGLPGTGGACGCTAIGVTACGALSDPACGGACPSGESCGSLTNQHGTFCSCVEDGVPCGPGPGDCGVDQECTLFPGGPWTCLPTFCGGSFPTCGGSCDPGRSCVPLEVTGSQFCVCATPGFSCDGPACGGGFNCPSGEVCTAAPPRGAARLNARVRSREMHTTETSLRTVSGPRVS